MSKKMIMADSSMAKGFAENRENVFAEGVSDGQLGQVSLEQFFEMPTEPGTKLEWVDGTLLKTQKLMSEDQLFILLNLKEKFYQTAAFKNREGSLESEFDAWLKPRHVRRPDLGYLTRKQIFMAGERKAHLIPSFAVEVISPSEKYDEAEDKLASYLAAGIEVVWHIFPKQRKVKIFRPGEKTEECLGDDAICSAAPALPDFQISVREIFQKG